jgi:RNA-directed DNA polymerase
MSEDASVNTGAVIWPELEWAQVRVRRMQTKLQCWAVGDPGRRFDDLYNLVCDPAFLVVAWQRVAGNKGVADPGGGPGHGGLDRFPGRGRGVPAGHS